MSKLTELALGVLTASLIAGAALADGPAMVAETSKGKVLADQKGMTLYIFDKDNKGTSNCYGKCATNWPPLMASAMDKAEGKWSIVKRKDGSMQWAYDGKPLYLWVKDKKAGDVTGDGVGKVWWVAKP